MTAWVLWSWHEPRGEWIEVCGGSQGRQKELAETRQAQADAAEVANCRFVALPTGQRPDGSMVPGTLPLDPPPAASPPSHFPSCWRSAAHHSCAVTLIERQAIENDRLAVQVAHLERTVRESAA